MDKHEGSIVVRSRCAVPEQNGSGTVFMLFFPDYGVGRPATAEPAERNVTPVASAQMA
jgi:hypothetical protein